MQARKNANASVSDDGIKLRNFCAFPRTGVFRDASLYPAAFFIPLRPIVVPTASQNYRFLGTWLASRYTRTNLWGSRSACPLPRTRCVRYRVAISTTQWFAPAPFERSAGVHLKTSLALSMARTDLGASIGSNSFSSNLACHSSNVRPHLLFPTGASHVAVQYMLRRPMQFAHMRISSRHPMKVGRNAPSSLSACADRGLLTFSEPQAIR